MLKKCFKEEKYLSHREFTIELNNNWEVMEILQFIFCSISPMECELINEINKFLILHKYNYNDSCYKLTKTKSYLIEIFEKKEKKDIGDFDENINEKDSEDEEINNCLSYNIKTLINPNLNQKNKLIGIPSRLSELKIKYSFYSYIPINMNRIELNDVFDISNYTKSSNHFNAPPLRNKYRSNEIIRKMWFHDC